MLIVSANPLVLVAVADPLLADLCARVLPGRGCRFDVASTLGAAIEALQRDPSYDLMIVEDSASFDAQALVAWARGAGREVDILVGSARAPSIAGVTDVISLPATPEVVALRVEQALERGRERLRGHDMASYMTQANAQLEAANQSVAALVRERNRQLDYLAQANAQIDELNQRMERLLGDRARQVTYLTQANAQIEEMNLRLDHYVAERTRALTEANEKLQEMTLTDELTGLYNQRWLRARLDEEYQRAQRHNQTFAVLMIDIDNFKNVNDSHDHLFGSDVLRKVGDLLKQGVRGIDIAVRYGGDEFCVVLPQTSLAGAVAVAERLRVALVRADVGDEGRPYKVTLSIGVAALGECEAQTGLGLLQAADHALYAAKENGRNRVAAMNGKHLVTSVG